MSGTELTNTTSKVTDPPAYEPTKCSQCATVIVLGEDEYSKLGKDYFCSDCTEKRLLRRAKERKGRGSLSEKLVALPETKLGD
jgi:hypothetical protein